MNPPVTFFGGSSVSDGIPSINDPYAGTVPFKIADQIGERLNPAALTQLNFTESTETAADRINPIAEQTRLIQLTNEVIVWVLGNLHPYELAQARLACKTLYILSNKNEAVQNSLGTVLPNLKLRNPCMFSFSQQFLIVGHYIHRSYKVLFLGEINRDIYIQFLNGLAKYKSKGFDYQENYDRMITTQEQALNGV